VVANDSRAVFRSCSASFSCLAVGHVDTRNGIWLVCVTFLSFSTSTLHSLMWCFWSCRPTDIGVSTGTAAVFDFSGYFSDTFSVILWCLEYSWNI
jgi:hypothetical protein